MIPRFSHVLIPLDLSPRNTAALDVAFEIAVENKARVSLLHVIQRIDEQGDEPDDELKLFYEQIRRRAESDIETLSQRFSEAGVDVETKVSVGYPLQDIVWFAESHRVDLIVMSSHPVNKDDIARSLGTLSYKVSIACQCPILLVK